MQAYPLSLTLSHSLSLYLSCFRFLTLLPCLSTPLSLPLSCFLDTSLLPVCHRGSPCGSADSTVMQRFEPLGRKCGLHRLNRVPVADSTTVYRFPLFLLTLLANSPNLYVLAAADQHLELPLFGSVSNYSLGGA